MKKPGWAPASTTPTTPGSTVSWIGSTASKPVPSPARLLTVPVILDVFVVSLALMPFIKLACFPRTDPGQFVVTVKAPTGTRVEMTEQSVAKVEAIIRRVVSKDDLGLIVSNIGVTPDFSAIYTSNSASHIAFVQASLKEGHEVGSYGYMDRVRAAIRRELPLMGFPGREFAAFALTHQPHGINGERLLERGNSLHPADCFFRAFVLISMQLDRPIEIAPHCTRSTRPNHAQ